MRVLSFCGRSHHLSRLLPIVSGLAERGHSVAFFTAPNCEWANFDAHTEHLIAQHIPYFYSSDYLDTDSRQSSDKSSVALLRTIWGRDFGGVGDIRSYVAPVWLEGGIREAEHLLFAWDKLYEQEMPDIVQVLHTNSFFARLAAFVATQRGIPTVGHAEGRLRHADQSTMGKQSLAGDYLTKLFVWSEGMKQAYIESGVDEKKLEVVGIVHLSNWIRDNSPETRLSIRHSLGIRNDWPIVTFAFPVLNRYEGNASLAIETFINWGVGKKVNLILKFHPFETVQNVNSVRNGVEKNGLTNVLVLSEGESAPIILTSDLVISQHSTAGSEAIALGVPFAEIDLDGVGITEDLASEGVAFLIGKGEIKKLDDILAGKSKLDMEVVEKWKSDNLGELDGGAVDRAVRSIESIKRITK